MTDFTYHGIWRMDWGLGNPNKTAALIVMLMVAVWLLGGIRKWGFWIALVLFTGLGVGLIHTFSRGGIIALFLGLAPVLYCAPRPWPRAKIIGAVISIWVMIGASICLDAGERYEQGVVKEDRSITNRLEIWKAAPRMMVDAPGGWGLGNSGNAYMQWYQSLNQNESYRTLVSSHLTWLVEFGWPLRFLYVFAWAAIVLLCWPSSGTRLLPISLGTWIAFGVAAMFSSVAESPWLWILPTACLIAVVVWRLRERIWPKPVLWTAPVASAVLIIAGFTVVGRNGLPIHFQGSELILGLGEPKTWVVLDTKVMGGHYGHTLRQYWAKDDKNDSAVGIVTSPDSLPSLDNKTVVLAGHSVPGDTLKSPINSAKNVIVLNPYFFPQEIGVIKDKGPSLLVAFGEFSSSPALNAWADVGTLKRLPGIGDFVPVWPELTLKTP